MRTFASVDEFCSAVGTHLGESPWTTVDQDRIDTFADATGDHQWIHVDPVRAADGPFGGTIAHGFLTLSMVPVMLGETFTVDGLQAFMNYGTDRIRFIRPVPAGSRIQASATLTSVEETPLGVRAVVSVEVRLEDGGKPACIADLITLLIR
jgi:acyl dehydratase